jgi:Spy/CpxP family protein refolding chaperone
MKKISVVLIAMLLIGFTTTLFAAPPGPGKQGPQDLSGHQGFRPFARLNLTQDQIGKMKELRKSFWANTHDLRYDIKMKRVEVQKLFTDPKTDDATLLAKEKELNDLRHQLMDKKAEMKVEWRKILTPDQIQKLDRMHRHHFCHCRGQHGKGHWRHHHQGGPMGKGFSGHPQGPMGHEQQAAPKAGQ